MQTSVLHSDSSKLELFCKRGFKSKTKEICVQIQQLGHKENPSLYNCNVWYFWLVPTGFYFSPIEADRRKRSSWTLCLQIEMDTIICKVQWSLVYFKVLREIVSQSILVSDLPMESQQPVVHKIPSKVLRAESMKFPAIQLFLWVFTVCESLPYVLE